MTDNYTLANDSEETPVLLIHSHGEHMYNKIYNLLVAFCVFALACFICGLVIIKNEVQQTVIEEMEEFQKKLFPGGGPPPRGGNPGNGHREDEGDSDSDVNGSSQDDNPTNERAPQPSRSAAAHKIWSGLLKKGSPFFLFSFTHFIKYLYIFSSCLFIVYGRPTEK